MRRHERSKCCARANNLCVPIGQPDFLSRDLFDGGGKLEKSAHALVFAHCFAVVLATHSEEVASFNCFLELCKLQCLLLAELTRYTAAEAPDCESRWLNQWNTVQALLEGACTPSQQTQQLYQIVHAWRTIRDYGMLRDTHMFGVERGMRVVKAMEVNLRFVVQATQQAAARPHTRLCAAGTDLRGRLSSDTLGKTPRAVPAAQALPTRGRSRLAEGACWRRVVPCRALCSAPTARRTSGASV